MPPIPLPPFASLLASGLNTPESAPAPPAPTLPALNLPMAAQGLPTAQPMSGLQTFAQPSVAPEPQGGGIGSILSQIAPLLVATIAGRKNPVAGAAILNGMATGALAAQRERMQADEHQAELRKLQFQFQRQVLNDVAQFTDPVERQQYLELAKQFGVESLGMSPNAIAAIPVPKTKQTDVLRKEITARLADFDKRYPQANTPDESQLSFRLSNGQTVSVPTARALVGQAVYDAKGQQAAPAAKPQKLDDFQTYFQSVVEDWKNQHGGQEPNAGIRRQLYLTAKSDIAGATKDPGLADLDRQIKELRIQTLQNGLQGKSNADTSPDPLAPHGSAFLDTLSPSDRQLVQQIADYKMDLTKVTSLRSDERTRIAKLVAQYDPTFDMSQYSSRSKLRSDFASGKGAQNIRSLNTAVGHLKSLNDAAKLLDNSSVPLWNAIRNRGLSASGDPRVVRFRTAANAVEGELAAVFKGTGATDQEIKSWREQLNSSQSPAQIHTAIETAIELMGSRLQALNDQWSAGMGKPKDFTLLSKKSRQILSSMGVDVNALDPVAGGAGGMGPSVGSGLTPTLRFNPATGRVEAIR